jgi:hypothetical protein
VGHSRLTTLENVKGAGFPVSVGTGIFGGGIPGGEGCLGILGNTGSSPFGACLRRTTTGGFSGIPELTGTGIFGWFGPVTIGVGCGLTSFGFGCMSFGAVSPPGAAP